MKIFCMICIIAAANFPSIALTSRVQFAHAEMSLKEGFEFLEPSFREKLEEYTAALKDAGLEMRFDNRRVSPKGQYLRYWAWQIANEGYRKTNNPPPPAFPGCDIDWFWITPDPDYFVTSAEILGIPSYIAAAHEMVEYFRLTERPLVSKKGSEGKAVHFYVCEIGQMSGLNSPRLVKGKDGRSYMIPFGYHHPGFKENPTLCALCATYGIYPARDNSDPELSRRGLSTQMWSDSGD